MGDPVAFKDGELDLALQLIDQLSSDRFEPSRYEDGYRQALLEMVDRKVAGEEVIAMPQSDSKEQIIDLMAALKKSIDGSAAERVAEAKKAATAKPASRKRKRA
jgi:DNA end-binding protein Ku